MPSGITHILFAKNTLLQDLPPNLRLVLQSGIDFFQIGSVAPDLPYASIADDDFFFTTESDLADKFHYEKTYQVPIYALNELYNNKTKLTKKQIRYAFCFFMGYISHIVADGIIHPYIRDKVGDYHDHQEEHRVLEMKLDVLLYDYLTESSGSALNLNNTNLHDELLNPTFLPEINIVLGYFVKMIEKTYNKNYSENDILGWIKGLHRMFGIAEGEHPFIYKVIGIIDAFLFKDYSELRANKDEYLILTKPVDRDLNFLKKDKIHYFNDILPHYYSRLIPILKKSFNYIYMDGDPITELDIPGIDLDTGRPLAFNNDLDLIPTFWT